MRRMLLLCIYCAVIVTGLADAKTKLYRWVDEQGNVHYTDKVPADQADQARKELNQQGMVVDSVEAAPTAEQIVAARAKAQAAAAARHEQEAQQRLDSILVNSYSSVVAIERAREDEIRALQRTVDMNLTAVDARQQQLRNLVSRAADMQRSARPVPASLVASMRQARTELNELHTHIDAKRAEQAEIFAVYEQRIKRYRELTTG